MKRDGCSSDEGEVIVSMLIDSLLCPTVCTNVVDTSATGIPI